MDGKTTRKWKFLEHKGPLFAPLYTRLPEDVKFRYDGKEVELSQAAEEVAGFYARKLDHDYTTKTDFNKNFIADWRKVMTKEEAEMITDLSKCDFKEMQAYFQSVSKKNKNYTKDKKAEVQEEYGFCTIDGCKEKIGNFKIEPPGIFISKGENPKKGKLKRRIMPEDVVINCSNDSKIPEAPAGHTWKEVKHDDTLDWLASWKDNIEEKNKYVRLHTSSNLMGKRDKQKYEAARELHKYIDQIRETYREHWKAEKIMVRQRAVALYFIDQLAFRIGNGKDDDQADTVGCCSLRVEHIKLHKEKDGKKNVVEFDFDGKTSIKYVNEVEVEEEVFMNLKLFMKDKKDSDLLFNELKPQNLNNCLKEVMPGLTAKVFRTYHASKMFQLELKEIDPEASIPDKILFYKRLIQKVAVLLNHKGRSKFMEGIKKNKNAKHDKEVTKSEKDLDDVTEKLEKLEVQESSSFSKLQETDPDANKTTAVLSSKLYYLDPRITVAWCQKHSVPIEKVCYQTLQDQIRWAMDIDSEFDFLKAI